MNEEPWRRLLQELRTGTSYHQISNYASSEINAIHREINSRFAEIEQILSRQRTALRRLILDAENGLQLPEDALTISEYPHFALWIHVSSIQQLQRVLHIYKHERVKCITDLIIASFATGHPISNESVSKLSTNEVQLMKRLQALVEHYGGMMITLCTGKFPFDRLQTTVELALGGAGVTFPDSQFCARMGRLAMVDHQPGVLEWSFEDEMLRTDTKEQENEEGERRMTQR